MTVSFKSWVRAIAIIGYLALCKAQFLPAWRSPNPDNSTVITRDFTVAGACTSLYVLEPINYQTVSIVDDPHAGLFSVGIDYDLLQETVSCEPTLVPAQSTSYTLILRAHASNGVADVSMTINHVPPSNNNADPEFFELDPISVARNAFETGVTTIKTVNVTDGDGDTVTLSVPTDQTYFSVNGRDIEVAASLMSLSGTYTLTITATDDGDPPRSTEAILTISLFNTVPVFTSPADGEEILMCENDMAGDWLATLVGSDDDGDDVIFLISNVDPAVDYFEIIGNELKIKTGVQDGTFDVDSPNAVTSYSLTLSAGDGISEVNITISIVVEDFNDHDPVLDGTWPMTKPIRERILQAGETLELLTVTATDGDLTDENKNFTFSLSGDSKFGIDQQGVISLIESVEFDEGPQYVLIINVVDTDDPNTALTATGTLTINIKTAPEFTSPQHGDEIPMCESDIAEDVLTTLLATDVDGDSFSFHLGSVDPAVDYFEIIGNELRIKTGVQDGTFDVESPNAVTSFSLTLSVRDGSFSTSVTISVVVEDFNDHEPVLDGSWPMTESLLETTLQGGETVDLVTVTSTDGDLTEENRNFTYQLTGSSKFSINQQGVVSLIESVDFVDGPQYVLSITVKDTDDPDTAFTGTGTLTVVIETAPEFTSPQNGNEIPMCESDIAEDVLTTLVATDDDGDSFSFDIGSVDPAVDYFEIIGNELKIKTGVPDGTFDVESPNAVTSFSLTLSVSDGNFSTSVTISVVVEDFNDHEPVLDGSWPMTESLLETTLQGGETVDLVTITTTDGDLTEENKNFTYQLTGSSKFGVNQQGVVSLIESVDFVDGPRYVLTITVTDTNDPDTAFTATGTLTVVIETAPEFVNLDTTLTVNENTAIDTEIYTFDVHDDDALPNAPIVSIHEDSDPTDAFDVLDNKLVNKKELNAETQQSYTLKFNCTDGKYIVTSVDVTVNIADLNDNPPVINTVTSVTINENLPAGSTVVSVNIIDADVTDPNNKVTWVIASGNDDGYFGVTSDTITLTAIPSSMTVNEFILTIEATDGGTPPQSATKDVTVTFNPGIINECDSSPCQNGATCTSYVNAYNCECGAGWKGTNCDTACHGNTFGLSCGEDCACNVSRVVNTQQQCEPTTGHCRCNAFWSGTSCETDVNECLVASTCAANRVCLNENGTFRCECKKVYLSKSYKEVNGECTEYNEMNDIPPGKPVIKASVPNTIGVTSQDLEIPEKYEEIRSNLKRSFDNALQETTDIYNIRIGSLVFNVVFLSNDNFGDIEQLATAIEELKSNGTITYDNQVFPLAVQDVGFTKENNDSSFLPEKRFHCDEQACYQCEAVNTQLKCTRIPKVSDNQALIWGLGGLMFALILAACIPILVCVCYRVRKTNEQKRRSRRRDRHRMKKVERSHSDRMFSSTPWQDRYSSDKLPQNGHISPYSIYNSRELNGKSSLEHYQLYN